MYVYVYYVSIFQIMSSNLLNKLRIDKKHRKSTTEFKNATLVLM